MNRTLLQITRALSCVLALPFAAIDHVSAQDDSSSKDQPTASTDESPLELNPFVVSTAAVSGYRASNSNTATRVSRSIMDTPISISVLTSAFLDDTNTRDRLDAVYNYVAGVSGDARTSNTTQGIFGSDLGTIRGFPVDKILRDGFDRAGNYTLRDVERVEILKGPVSVFYGSAQPGGTINYVSKRPRFGQTFGELDLHYGGYASKWTTDEQSATGTEVDASYNGYYKNLVAYRVSSFVSDRNGWHDREYFRQQGVTPSLLIHPFPKMELFVQFDYQKADTAPSAESPTGNANFYRDYASPPAQVLAANNLSAAQYQSTIFSSNTNWVNRGRTAYGNTKAIADQYGLYRMATLGYWIWGETNPFGRPSFSFQGAGNHVDNENETINLEFSYTPTDWLTIRYAFGFDHAYSDFLQTSSTVPNADGRTIFVGTGGQQSSADYRRQQLNVLLSKRVGPIENHLLLNLDYNGDTSKTRNYKYNYANVYYSTVGANGVVKTGSQVYANYDVFLDPITPDLGLIANGYDPYGFGYARQYGRAFYDYAEIDLFGHKIMPAVGYRVEARNSASYVVDNFFSTISTRGPSKTYGLTVELAKGVNLYSSYNTNFRPNNAVSATGSGVNRDVNANIVPGLNEVYPLADQTGKGLDFGLKFDLLGGRLSGSLSWYRVERANILIQDSTKTLTDPRNVPGTFYPNGAGVLTQVTVGGFLPVQFFNTTGAERNEGVELEANWSVSRNYSIIFSLSNIYSSRVVSNSSLTGAERDILFNRRLAKSPEYQGGLWNRYSFSSGRLKGLAVGAGAHGQTKTMPRYDSYLDQDGFNKAFLVIDLNLDYTTTIASKKTRLSLSVNNLTDKLYNLGTFAYGQPRKMEFTVKTFF